MIPSKNGQLGRNKNKNGPAQQKIVDDDKRRLVVIILWARSGGKKTLKQVKLIGDSEIRTLGPLTP